MIRRSLLFSYIAACVILLITGQQSISQPVSQAQDRCLKAANSQAINGLPSWWTKAEVYAWQEICMGRVADMLFAPNGERYATCDATSNRQWPEGRSLSPEFIREIVSRTPWVDLIPRQLVHIKCATIGGDLDLSSMRTKHSIWIESTRIYGDVDLSNSTIDTDLSLSASTVENEGKLKANDLTLTGDFFLRRGLFSEIQATGLKIGGNFDLSGARVQGIFRVRDAKIGGGLFMRAGARFQNIDLTHSSVGTDIDAEDAVFDGLFNAGRLRVAGGVFLRGGSEFDVINLVGAQIGGTLDASGSTVTNRLVADRVQINGNFFFRDGASISNIRILSGKVSGDISGNGSKISGAMLADGLETGGSLHLWNGGQYNRVELKEANIGASLRLYGSQYNGEVDLSGTKIGGALVLSSTGVHPSWGPNATLDLRNVVAQSLQATMPVPSSRHTDIEHPWYRIAVGGARENLPVDLGNFHYERLGSFGERRGSDLTRIDADRLVTWLESSNDAWDGDFGYTPHSYMHLADLMRSMGAEDAANRIDHARMMHRMNTRENDFLRLMDKLLYYFVGFGIYPAKALIYFSVLVILGWLYLLRSPDFEKLGILSRFLFSLNNALPLVPLSPRHEAIFLNSSERTLNLFTVQKILGFVLATVLVGALTLLGG